MRLFVSSSFGSQRGALQSKKKKRTSKQHTASATNLSSAQETGKKKKGGLNRDGCHPRLRSIANVLSEHGKNVFSTAQTRRKEKKLRSAAANCCSCAVTSMLLPTNAGKRCGHPRLYSLLLIPFVDAAAVLLLLSPLVASFCFAARCVSMACTVCANVC